MEDAETGAGKYRKYKGRGKDTDDSRKKGERKDLRVKKQVFTRVFSSSPLFYVSRRVTLS